MNDELNILSYDNTKITFTNSVDNIATSDELTATMLYQDKMGTAYSKSKAVARMFNVAGISLILTAAALKTGNIISNIFIVDPPYVVEESSEFVFTEEGAFYQFTISNVRNYEVFCYLKKDGKEVFKQDCSEEKTYSGIYSDYEIGQKLDFYIDFTNRFDLKQTIWHQTLKVEA